MMLPAEVVLAIAHQRGITLWLEQPSRIRYHGPAGVRTDDLRRLVGMCREDLIRLLAESCAVCRSRRPIMLVDTDGVSVCSRCDRERRTS